MILVLFDNQAELLQSQWKTEDSWDYLLNCHQLWYKSINSWEKMMQLQTNVKLLQKRWSLQILTFGQKKRLFACKVFFLSVFWGDGGRNNFARRMTNGGSGQIVIATYIYDLQNLSPLSLLLLSIYFARAIFDWCYFCCLIWNHRHWDILLPELKRAAFLLFCLLCSSSREVFLPLPFPVHFKSTAQTI